MKTIQDFFEQTDFSYLNLSESIEKDYYEIWKDVYLPSQEKKAIENKLSEDSRIKAFNGLSKRGYFLCQLYDFFDCTNIAEVGTAEGFQFYTFCHHIKEKGVVYSCDIRDVRKLDYVNKYINERFVSGTSKEMSEKIVNDEKEIDLFWIDGGHHNSAVIYDVIRLAKTQSKNPVWVFDDFNERFGIHQELKWLSGFQEHYTFSLGPTASGKPNNMLILKGQI